MKSWYLLLRCLHLRSDTIREINQNYHFYWKWPENFLGRGFLPWVGRVTGNDNIILSRLMAKTSLYNTMFEVYKGTMKRIEVVTGNEAVGNDLQEK